ncbi:MAG: glucose-1-phosphate adenylyltransferase [spirochete symbiont of Stewartia floridana]|nr:MAG: glucose-1-phosphate adenylyltransferase [spirochete symbiont of Stewartia floridana]
MDNVLTIILGGGRGSRLYPLTAERAKPACPFGGKYRLVDIPISNSINSGFRRIYVLTQYNSASLHLHIGRTYNFDSFSKDFCEILAAEQTLRSEDWYGGTADAVRKNFEHFRVERPSHYIILSGDQLYRMDLGDFMRRHIGSGMQVSIAATPVSREAANELGILKVDSKDRITEFLEKPGPEKNIDGYKMPHSTDAERQGNKEYLASMGIYIFDADVMERLLGNDKKDFGKEIIPDAIGKVKVGAYTYRGYWEDIGTIKNFYEANLDLGSPRPQFNLYDQHNPLYTHRRDLPPTKINSSTMNSSIASEGSIITDAAINRCLIGIRTIIRAGARLDGVYTMGADYYETYEQWEENRSHGIPGYGVDEGTSISGAIIDRNARIGRNCRIGVDQMHRQDGDYEGYSIRDGIIIILKGAVIPDDTRI